jgi:hypothetical protein
MQGLQKVAENSECTVRIAILGVIIAKSKTGPTATVGTGLPGRFGVDYQFINESAIDIYVDKNKVTKSLIEFKWRTVSDMM